MKAQTTKFVHFNFLIVFEGRAKEKKSGKTVCLKCTQDEKSPKKLFKLFFYLSFYLSFSHEKKA